MELNIYTYASEGDDGYEDINSVEMDIADILEFVNILKQCNSYDGAGNQIHFEDISYDASQHHFDITLNDDEKRG
jgi:hypothetical protein